MSGERGSAITHDEAVSRSESSRLSAIQTIPLKKLTPLNPKLTRDLNERVTPPDPVIDRRGLDDLHPILS